MKKLLLALFGATILSSAAMAQSGTNTPVGQDPSGTVNQSNFNANTDPSGFSEQSSAQPVAVGTVTATATILPTRFNYPTCASGATALRLPAVQRYTPIMIANRSGTTCLIFPSTGDKLETALGTVGAANASYSLPTNTDVTFRPIIIAGVTTWLQ